MRIERRPVPSAPCQFPPHFPASLQRIFMAREVFNQAQIDYRLPHLLRPDALFDLSSSACSFMSDSMLLRSRLN